MRKVLACVVGLLPGCSLYFGDGERDRGPGPFPLIELDAGSFVPTDAMPLDCYNLTCAPGFHTEPQCEPLGNRGCVRNCHCTCVPDVRCDQIDCGSNATCIEMYSTECVGMPQTCAQTCVNNASLPLCESLTDEVSCIAQDGCIPIYRGTHCTCDALACTCQEDKAAFARCAEAAPP